MKRLLLVLVSLVCLVSGTFAKEVRYNNREYSADCLYQISDVRDMNNLSYNTIKLIAEEQIVDPILNDLYNTTGVRLSMKDRYYLYDLCYKYIDTNCALVIPDVNCNDFAKKQIKWLVDDGYIPRHDVGYVYKFHLDGWGIVYMSTLYHDVDIIQINMSNVYSFIDNNLRQILIDGNY